MKRKKIKVEKIGRRILDIFGSGFVFLSILIVFKGGIAFIPVAVFFSDIRNSVRYGICKLNDFGLRISD